MLAAEGPHDGGAPGRGHLSWLAGAGFCFGLGLWDKFSFLWFLLALSTALWILFPRQLVQRLRPATAAALVSGFLIGALPLVIYNLRGREPGTGEVVHWGPLDRVTLVRKCKKLQTTLDGRLVYGVVGGWAMELREPGWSAEILRLAYHRVGSWVSDPKMTDSVSDGPQFVLDALARLGPSGGTLLPVAFVCAALVAAAAAGARRPILFPLLVTLAMWGQMFPLGLAGEGAHHFVLPYPFPHLAVSAAGAWLWSRASHWGRRALALALLALVLTQLGWDARYLRAFRQTGGLWNWTEAIYEVGEYLNSTRPELVMNMDWGGSYPLLLLTRGRVPQQDFYAVVVFGDASDETAHVQKLRPLLARPNTLFLFHAEPLDNFPTVRKVFERTLAVSGMRERPVRTFRQKTGEPAIVLIAVEPAPPAL